jgi:hypothetical protein
MTKCVCTGDTQWQVMFSPALGTWESDNVDNGSMRQCTSQRERCRGMMGL